MTPGTLPLFPLKSVLFPGGRLELRIFEQRYLHMVAECSRSGSGFGVCLILQGDEAGAPAVPAAIGTLARIVDFATLPDGLLGITARGEDSFHVERTRVRDNGLVLGEVTFRSADPIVPVPPEFGLLATLLDRIAERVGGELGSAVRASFDDSSWVGFRLAEILPLSMPERQQLLQIGDPVERLRVLAHWLPRFQKA